MTFREFLNEGSNITIFQFDKESDREDLTYELHDEFPGSDDWSMSRGSTGYVIEVTDLEISEFIADYIKKNKIKAREI